MVVAASVFTISDQVRVVNSAQSASLLAWKAVVFASHYKIGNTQLATGGSRTLLEIVSQWQNCQLIS